MSDSTDFIKSLGDALQQETRQRDEIIAWRNRFPEYVYVPQYGTIHRRGPTQSPGPISDPTSGQEKP